MLYIFLSFFLSLAAFNLLIEVNHTFTLEHNRLVRYAHFCMPHLYINHFATYQYSANIDTSRSRSCARLSNQ
uniref:Secreted peptide n=1 Tax=Rhipicephalus pulchellus TaxID=72859 RepID=L7LXH7_RHIPC